MEQMPEARVMGDAVLTPDGKVRPSLSSSLRLFLTLSPSAGLHRQRALSLSLGDAMVLINPFDLRREERLALRESSFPSFRRRSSTADHRTTAEATAMSWTRSERPTPPTPASSRPSTILSWPLASGSRATFQPPRSNDSTIARRAFLPSRTSCAADSGVRNRTLMPDGRIWIAGRSAIPASRAHVY